MRAQGTVATTISSTKELTISLFRLFAIIEEGIIPSTEETAADIQECARGVMKLIQIATGMSRELPIDQYSDLLFQQSERVRLPSSCAREHFFTQRSFLLGGWGNSFRIS